ncbi:MAG: TetR/AcrR family transcriptional regulator [Muribaculaceae bacterium]|nr:TetR/AcrR family transcriptional regulator [Muribaculaceae bacterium]
MVSKTREKLIEVARQLFLNKGVENTTMNDIAAASDKGRRTIYTYFKNKREIYNAVVEQQSEILVKELRGIAASDITPEEKLRKYLYSRFQILTEIQQRPERSRYFFNRDHKRLERIHRMALNKELEILRSVLHEGVSAGVFKADQSASLPIVEAVMAQAVDFTSVRDGLISLNMSGEDIRNRLVSFIVNSILTHPQNELTIN